MQALTLPAGRGLRWLVEGFSIFQHRPALLSFLVLGYWLSMAVISAIPLFGQLASFLLIPVFSVSLMNACRLIDRKEELPPQVLFSGFHRNLQTLLTLGVVYVLATLVILGLSALFDGGLLFRMLVMGETPAREVLNRASARGTESGRTRRACSVLSRVEGGGTRRHTGREASTGIGAQCGSPAASVSKP